MELYTVDSTFLLQDVIDEFTSLIWTERYTEAGDVNLVLPATPKSMALLPEGRFLGLKGSKEVMMIETQLVEDGVLKVSGKSLLEVLKQRFFRTSNSHKVTDGDVSTTSPIGAIIGDLVRLMCIDGPYVSGTSPTGIDGPKQKIPNLTLGSIDNAGITYTLPLPFGELYAMVVGLANTYLMGLSLYLESADVSGYSLKFKVYRGLDRTSTQTDNSLVRFAPSLDSLRQLKELRSLSGYKNVAYVFSSAVDTFMELNPPGVAYAMPADADALGFDRRVLVVTSSDVTAEMIDANPVIMQNLLNAEARNALANNNFIRAVDGEVVPQSEFQYGTHYNMGDVIELVGLSGLAQKARITEFIQSQDGTGERAYPTVSVID